MPNIKTDAEIAEAIKEHGLNITVSEYKDSRSRKQLLLDLSIELAHKLFEARDKNKDETQFDRYKLLKVNTYLQLVTELTDTYLMTKLGKDFCKKLVSELFDTHDKFVDGDANQGTEIALFMTLTKFELTLLMRTKAVEN